METKPKLKAPAGTTDTHIHFFSKRYPKAPTARMDPSDASHADYLAMCRRLGIERTVVVQSSIYGTDNAMVTDGIGAIGIEHARGVAVVDESVDDGELERLTRKGVRGQRFHMLPGGVIPWEKVERIAARVQEVGWHSQIQFDGREWPERIDLARRLPGTLVIDHTGKFLEPVAPDAAAFKLLLGLVGEGRTYVKLSAPYETSRTGPPHYADVGRLAKALVAAAPDRMLWASNWPHPTPGATGKPDDALLLDVLLDWVPDAAVRQRILVDNPARLYGF
jgi:D-galactarolactone isomerase